MIRRNERNDSIRGISVKRGAPRISHVFFVDDSIIFSELRLGNVHKSLRCWQTMRRNRGQKLNKEKTSLFFSKNTSLEIQEMAKETFGAKLSNSMRSTLGFPY